MASSGSLPIKASQWGGAVEFNPLDHCRNLAHHEGGGRVYPPPVSQAPTALRPGPTGWASHLTCQWAEPINAIVEALTTSHPSKLTLGFFCAQIFFRSDYFTAVVVKDSVLFFPPSAFPPKLRQCFEVLPMLEMKTSF